MKTAITKEIIDDDSSGDEKKNKLKFEKVTTKEVIVGCDFSQ